MIRTFSRFCVNVTRNVMLYVCICVDTQSQCVLREIQMQMLFTSVVLMETTSHVTFCVLHHKVLKVSDISFHSCENEGDSREDRPDAA